MTLPSTYVAVDFETTGPNPHKARICSIAMAYVQDGKIMDSWYTLCDPRMVMPEDAYKIHGISDEMLADEPNFRDLAPDVMEWIEGQTLVTFNGERYDLPLLRHELERNDGGEFPPCNHVDVYLLAKERMHLGAYNLKACCEAIRSPVMPDHNAMNDVKATIHLFEHLKLAKPMTVFTDDASKEARAEFTVHIAKLQAVIDESPPVKANALRLLMDQIVKVHHWAKNATELPCEDEEDYQLTVKAEIALKKLKSELEKQRKSSTAELKAITSSIDKTYREEAIKPITNAIDALNATRRPYLSKLHEAEMERERIARAHANQVAEAERKAELKRTGSQAAANAIASVTQAMELEDINVKAPVIRTRLGSGSLKTTYKVEVINELNVPRAFWTPDLALIQAAVDLNPTRPIPGVLITPIFKTATRSKR